LNTQEVIGSFTENTKSLELTVSFAWVHADNYNSSTGGSDKDYDCNCIHILDNSGKYGQLGSRDAADGSRGAVLQRFFGLLPPGSQLYTGGYASYQSGWTNPNAHHGFAGSFGNFGLTGGRGPVGIAGGTQPLKITRFTSYHASMWQQARTGTEITSNVALTAAPGTHQLAYTNSHDNWLNIDSSVWYQGIDVNTGQTVGGYLDGGKCYG
jgi:hypothetical protein